MSVHTGHWALNNTIMTKAQQMRYKPRKIISYLQRAGISPTGASQLMNERVVTNEADRVSITRLILSVLNENPKPRSSPVPPPVPPVPLPLPSPIILTGVPSGRSGRQSDGNADSIWLDLGYPVTNHRKKLQAAGMSVTGIDQLIKARPVTHASDRRMMARILMGL